MTYRINRTDGSEIVKLNTGEIDQISTDITLIGDNYSNYGEYLNENFIKLLENFASTSQPDYPVLGQVWYDREHERLKVYTDAGFDDVRSTLVSSTQPVNLQQGDIWVDPIENQLYFYDGAQLQLAGPVYKTSQGTSGFVVENVLDTTQRSRTILKLFVGNILIGIFSKDAEFTPLNSITGLVGSIKPGFNASTLTNLKFRVTASDTLSLIDATGQRRTVSDFMSSDANTSTTGIVTLQNISPLVIGSTNNNIFLFNFNNFRIISSSLNQNYRLKITNTNGLVEAVTINAIDEHVGIFKSSPQATLHVGGNMSLTGNVESTGLTDLSSLVTQPISVLGNSINLATGNYFTKTITENTTLSLTSLAAISTSYTFYLDFIMYMPYAITWWSGVHWANGIAPTFSENTRHLIKFTTSDRGLTWSASKLGSYIVTPLYIQWTDIFSGYYTFIGIDNTSTVRAWGFDPITMGLGSSILFEELNPAMIDNSSPNWQKVTGGGFQSIAIKTDGSLWGWGENILGVLGDQYAVGENVSIPVPIFPSSDWIDIGNGSSSVHGIKSNGSLWSWGYNGFGQLGNNSTDDSLLPVQESTNSTNWEKIFAYNGPFTTVAAIKNDGSLWSWGYNSYGTVGNGTYNNNISSPVSVLGNKSWSTVSLSGYRTIAIDSDSALWYWGGVYGWPQIYSPIPVPSVPDFAQPYWQIINAGYYVSSLIDGNGKLFLSGYNNLGQLGLGFTSNSNGQNLEIAGGGSWASVDNGGYYNTAGIKTDGTLWSWGDNSSGQLGDGTTINRSSPVQVAGGGTWLKISYGSAIKSDGSLWAWGGNNYGQLGDGTTTNRSSPVQVAGGGTWSSISAGLYHAGGIKTDGSLWTWGLNNYGVLGDGTTTNRSSPVQIAGGSTWTSVSLAAYHSSAIKSDGTLWSWGWNNFGQLGNGTTTDRSSPVQVAGGGTWTLVSTSTQHTSAIKSDGTLWSWGTNNYGVLGDGTTSHRSSPVQVAGGGTWTSVSVGEYHTLAIKSNGSLWTWGWNYYGQMGLNAPVSSVSPIYFNYTDKNPTTGWSSVAGNYSQILAVKNDGTLWAMGNNTYGELLTSSPTSFPALTQISVDTNWQSVNLKYSYSGYEYNHLISAIKTDKSLWIWGDNRYGQVGDGSKNNASSPVSIPGGWNQISFSERSTFGIKEDGSIWSWGTNHGSALGIGQPGENTNGYLSPVLVLDNEWVKFSSSWANSAGIKTDNTLWVWGQNTYGQLGNGTTTSALSPVQVSGGGTWKDISVSEDSTLAIKSDDTLWAWGLNDYNQLGDGTTTNRSSPVLVLGNKTWKKIKSYNNGNYNNGTSSILAIDNNDKLWSWSGCYFFPEYYGTAASPVYAAKDLDPVGGTDWEKVSALWSGAAIKTDGTLWTWGDNYNGELGVGHTINLIELSQVDGIWEDVVSRGGFMIGLKTDGTLWSWGWNIYGKLGDGTTTNRSSPVQVAGGGTWLKISYGSAIKSDGSLWAWGVNNYGQLGDGTTSHRSSPVQVAGGGTWTSVSSGGSHNSAIKTDGTLWSWGWNIYGKLGDGTTTNRSSPVQVAGGGTWLNVAAGDYHTLAIKNDGTLWAWGGNYNGELGDGTTTLRSSPVQVAGASTWSTVSGGRYYSLAIKSNGSLWSWGDNSYGSVGDGTTINRSSPVLVLGSIVDWISISAGDGSTAIRSDGTMWTWGEPYGTGGANYGNPYDSNPRSSPFYIGNLVNDLTSNWTEIATGDGAVYALKDDGTLWSAGTNQYGQLGNDSVNVAVALTKITEDNTWIQVSAYNTNAAAIKSNGSLWTWGEASYTGVLGDDVNSNRSSPGPVAGTNENWIKVAVGYDQMAAIKTDGTLWAWGDYPIGDGTTQQRSSPTQIIG